MPKPEDFQSQTLAAEILRGNPSHWSRRGHTQFHVQLMDDRYSTRGRPVPNRCWIMKRSINILCLLSTPEALHLHKRMAGSPASRVLELRLPISEPFHRDAFVQRAIQGRRKHRSGPSLLVRWLYLISGIEEIHCQGKQSRSTRESSLPIRGYLAFDVQECQVGSAIWGGWMREVRGRHHLRTPKSRVRSTLNYWDWNETNHERVGGQSIGMGATWNHSRNEQS